MKQCRECGTLSPDDTVFFAIFAEQDSRKIILKKAMGMQILMICRVTTVWLRILFQSIKLMMPLS